MRGRGRGRGHGQSAAPNVGSRPPRVMGSRPIVGTKQKISCCVAGKGCVNGGFSVICELRVWPEQKDDSLLQQRVVSTT